MTEYITTYNGCQVEVRELLEDSRFEWVGHRRDAVRIGRLYRFAGQEGLATRCLSCGTYLVFSNDADGKVRLQAANFCKARLCPMCGARRARRNAGALSRIMERCETERSGLRWLFLTLTCRNCSAENLNSTLTTLTDAWKNLNHDRTVRRAVCGWFRALEITHSARQDARGEYHPHLHAILAVDEYEYFTAPSYARTYIDHDEWISLWRRALRADYNPAVRIQATRDKDGKARGMSAAVEAAKYATKSTDVLSAYSDSEAARILMDYTVALRGRRLMGFGGIMRSAARALKLEALEVDKDLIHTDDEETLRDDIAILYSQYQWNAALGQYICTKRWTKEEYEALRGGGRNDAG